jgi:hypothetical protein
MLESILSKERIPKSIERNMMVKAKLFPIYLSFEAFNYSLVPIQARRIT